MEEIVTALMGSVAVGFENQKLMTLGLGSCIGIVLFEPGKKIASMGHIMLPDHSSCAIKKEDPKSRILLAIEDISMAIAIEKILSMENLEVSKNYKTKEEILTNYSSLKPNLVMLDDNIIAMNSDLFSGLMTNDYQSNILMVSNAFKQYLLFDMLNRGAKDFILPPFLRERISTIVNVNLHPYQLKYATIMIPYMVEKLTMMGLKKENLHAKIAGGAQMFAGNDIINVGGNNISKTKEVLSKYGIKIDAEETGGTVGRTLHFDVNSSILHIRTKDSTKDI